MSESPQLEVLDLGTVLLRTTRLEPDQLEQARARQLESGESLPEILIEEGMLNADELRRGLAEQLGLELRSELLPEDIDEATAIRVPIGFAKQHSLVAVGETADGAVRVVVGNPLSTAPLDDLRLLFDGAEIELELASERLILEAINVVYDHELQVQGNQRGLSDLDGRCTVDLAGDRGRRGGSGQRQQQEGKPQPQGGRPKKGSTDHLIQLHG